MPSYRSLITALWDGSTDVDTPVYFDAASWTQFEYWARRSNPTDFASLVKRIADDGLQIRVVKEQLASMNPATRANAEKLFAALDITYDLTKWSSKYDMYASELQSVYFHDEVPEVALSHAKFLILARYATSGNELRVLSAHAAFQRLVNAKVFLLSKPVIREMPASFDIFADLSLHERLERSVSGHFRSKNYPTAVFEAAKELSQYLRDLSGLKTDGITLVDQALDFSARSGTPPKLKVNNFVSQSDQEEQKGFHQFCSGVTKAIRNPSAHNTAADPFIVSRFSDQMTTIRVLCFLSMLLEKLDNATVQVKRQ